MALNGVACETDEKLVRLKESINIKDLLAEDGTTFEVNFDDLKEDEQQLSYDPKEAFEYANPECLGLIDEDTYQDGEPFENLSRKMTNILDNGKIKKRILREGYGEVLPDKSMVTIDYNAYLEYNDEPFDSTYLRKKTFTFRLNDEQTLPGLDVSVQSMRLDEKSQFLVHPDYAYGPLGCIPRVPPNATVLYEIEIKNSVDSGACITYHNLSEEKQRDFVEVYKYAHALCSKANDLFGKGLIKQAIKDYNIAASKLEMCQLRDYEDQIKQEKLLLRLRTNLVVAHTKIQEPRRACTNCNKIYNMCKGTDLKVPVKVYFNHARSLILLCDYEWAEKQLKKAHQLKPQDEDINKEFRKLDLKREESYKREKALAEAIFRNTKQNKELQKKNEISKEFQDSITQYCKELIEDKEATQYRLPEKLTKDELEFAEKEALKHGLEFKCFKSDDIEKYFFAKPSDVV